MSAFFAQETSATIDPTYPIRFKNTGNAGVFFVLNDKRFESEFRW